MTRLRLTSSTTAPGVSPTIQSYTHDQGSRRRLLLTDSSALTTSAYTPDAADHHVAGDAHHIQFVSAPLSAGIVFTSGDTLDLCVQGSQPNSACNQFLQVFVSVVDSAGTTVRATIRSKVVDGTEFGGVLSSKYLSTTLSASYTTVADDRLVVEISTEGTPVAGGGVNGHNTSIRWGGDGAGGDLPSSDGDSGTTLNPWIDFPSSTITENTGTTVSLTVIARSFTTPAVTVKGSAVTALTAIARSFTTPAVTVKGAAKTTPAAIATVVTTPAVTVKGGAVVAPAVIGRSFTLPQVTAGAGGTAGSVSPAVIPTVGATPAVTVKGAAVAAPSVVARSFATPAVTVKGGAVTAPAAIARSFTLDAVTVKGAASTAPSVIARAFTAPAVTIKGGLGVALATIAGNFALAAVTVKGAAVVTPSVIPLSVVMPGVTVTTGLVDFWNYNPAGYTVNPAAYAVNPAAYVPVTKDDDPPWD